MKFLLIAIALFSNVALAGDLGVFSDGGKGAYRVYHQTGDKIIIRQGSKAWTYFYSGKNKFEANGSEVEVLDSDHILWTVSTTARLLTKKNDCQ